MEGFGHDQPVSKRFASSLEGAMSERTQKLVSIRRRTDHDLLVLVQRELVRGFALADVATSRNSLLFAQAEKTITTAAAMLRMGHGDRVQIEVRLKELRSRLDQIPAYANVRPYAASFAS
jgi:hypothetical protein